MFSFFLRIIKILLKPIHNKNKKQDRENNNQPNQRTMSKETISKYQGDGIPYREVGRRGYKGK